MSASGRCTNCVDFWLVILSIYFGHIGLLAWCPGSRHVPHKRGLKQKKPKKPTQRRCSSCHEPGHQANNSRCPKFTTVANERHGQAASSVYTYNFGINVTQNPTNPRNKGRVEAVVNKATMPKVVSRMSNRKVPTSLPSDHHRVYVSYHICASTNPVFREGPSFVWHVP